MNKFAKYVPEEDKKKQREFIGIDLENMGGSSNLLKTVPNVLTYDGLHDKWSHPNHKVIQVSSGTMIVKISDDVPTNEELIGCKATIDGITKTITENDIAPYPYFEGVTCDWIFQEDYKCIHIVRDIAADSVYNEWGLTTGIWFEYDWQDHTPRTLEYGTKEVLDPKYLPEGIVGGVVTLYAKERDQYIYTNADFTNKPTYNELATIMSSGAVRVFYAFNDDDPKYLSPVAYTPYEDMGMILVMWEPTSDAYAYLFTAEHVPMD